MRKVTLNLTGKSEELLNEYQKRVGKRSLTHLINDAIVICYGGEIGKENNRTVRKGEFAGEDAENFGSKNFRWPKQYSTPE